MRILKRLIIDILIIAIGINIGINTLHEREYKILEANTVVEAVKPLEVVKGEEVDEFEDLEDIALRKVPADFKNKIENTLILVTDGQLEEEFEEYEFSDSDILGFYDVYEDLIVLESVDEAVYESLTHEIGHLVDIFIDENGDKQYNFSNTEEFIKIWEAEKELLFDWEGSEYFKETAVEYFAEAYSKYVSDSNYFRNSLKTKAPKTYNYFKNTVFAQR